MKTKAIVAGAIVLVVLLFIALLFSIPRTSLQEITVRHVGSVQSANVTTLTFEITNHTAAEYTLFPEEVQIRNGNGWSRFPGFNYSGSTPYLGPTNVFSYTIDVTNMPPGSVRFRFLAQRILRGVEGFVKRAEINHRNWSRGWNRLSISMNPNDKKDILTAPPIFFTSEEWIEPGGDAER